ncbi:hypothetical protein Mpt1_c04670 [Candidatus Methanoplasma termitum]|uniref:Uncharacterized protein n=1 Tax=Candidatus Methanoplasma termitum TaxID=1577791 RepID=A0A0A7LBA9_9ARCH|nr:hypothetical protein [Candidatus Methanoplasma termitum]AIZ56359.1 hypothetical protein Mpt1_c04670 [Candidatus Methanoplasma termitum]MCL2333667.1 hypothetical protein [Candidatus Methanoplasma sp.]
MAFFGLTDPFIIAGYLGCFLTVAACCIWAVFWKEKEGEDITEDDIKGEE